MLREKAEKAKAVEMAESTELRVPRLRAKEPLGLSVREVIACRRDPAGQPTGTVRRFMVCPNAERARRVKAVREATVEKLRERLSKGPQALVAKRGSSAT